MRLQARICAVKGAEYANISFPERSQARRTGNYHRMSEQVCISVHYTFCGQILPDHLIARFVVPNAKVHSVEVRVANRNNAKITICKKKLIVDSRDKKTKYE